MVESRQSAGGKARAQKLSKQERSDIARTAAAARWTPAPDHVGELPVKAEDERHHLQCGAAVVRNTIARLPEEERKSFILMLWPTLPKELCELVARFPDETRINGSQLHLPASWYSISGVKAPATNLLG
jgi:hypothetical protein